MKLLGYSNMKGRKAPGVAVCKNDKKLFSPGKDFKRVYGKSPKKI